MVVRSVPVFPPMGVFSEVSALASVLRHWGVPLNPDSLKEQMVSGVSARRSVEGQIGTIACRYGLWACAEQGDMDQLRERIRHGVPVVVLLQGMRLGESRLRAAVVTGYSGGSWQVIDGGGKSEWVEASAFERGWAQQDHWMLVLAPPGVEWRFNAAERICRARFFEMKRRYAPAIQEYEAALVLGAPASESLGGIGTCLRELGQIAEAEMLYRQALALNPLSARACNNLAFLLCENAVDVGEALVLARRAFMLDPTNPRVLDTLGFALLRTGDYAEAARVLERARARAVREPAETRQAIAVRLARVYRLDGQTHLTRAILRELSDQDPAFRPPDDVEDVLREKRREP